MPTTMSAIGGRPAAAIVSPDGASVAVEGWVIARVAISTGVMLWVVASQLSTTSSRAMPAALAMARWVWCNCRSGSSEQPLATGSNGSVVVATVGQVAGLANADSGVMNGVLRLVRK